MSQVVLNSYSYWRSGFARLVVIRIQVISSWLMLEIGFYTYVHDLVSYYVRGRGVAGWA